MNAIGYVAAIALGVALIGAVISWGIGFTSFGAAIFHRIRTDYRWRVEMMRGIKSTDVFAAFWALAVVAFALGIFFGHWGRQGG